MTFILEKLELISESRNRIHVLLFCILTSPGMFLLYCFVICSVRWYCCETHIISLHKIYWWHDIKLTSPFVLQASIQSSSGRGYEPEVSIASVVTVHDLLEVIHQCHHCISNRICLQNNISGNIVYITYCFALAVFYSQPPVNTTSFVTKY